MKTTSLAPYRRLRSASVGSILSIFLLAAPILAFGAPRPAPSTAPASEPKLDLTVAAAVVQHAIAKYQTKASPKLESADLTFKVTSGKAGGVGFSFWIITIGFSTSETKVQTVSFSYKVPGSDKPAAATPTATPTLSPGTLSPEVTTQLNREFLDIKMLGNLDIEAFAEKDVNMMAESLATRSGYRAPNMKQFEDDLVKAIDGAAKAVRETPNIGGAEFQTFSVTIDYSVKFEGSGSASIPVFSVLTIGPKGSISRDTAHSLKLTFRK
jgi:hypothetical protein